MGCVKPGTNPVNLTSNAAPFLPILFIIEFIILFPSWNVALINILPAVL